MSDIVKGGLVESDGRLTQGDQILSVNGEDVRSATQEAVAALLKVQLPLCVMKHPFRPALAGKLEEKLYVVLCCSAAWGL